MPRLISPARPLFWREYDNGWFTPFKFLLVNVNRHVSTFYHHHSNYYFIARASEQASTNPVSIYLIIFQSKCLQSFKVQIRNGCLTYFFLYFVVVSSPVCLALPLSPSLVILIHFSRLTLAPDKGLSVLDSF